MRIVEHLHRLVQWIALGALVGVSCGVASAVFLILLDVVTDTRATHEWLVWCLPIAGLALGLVYARWGKSILGGNNLVIDSVHESSEKIPLRMAPMVLLGTVITHLFGGSAGREGAAVQIGASIADDISHRLRLTRETRTQLLAAGISGGFGSVFGTPVAGTLFGLEVVTCGRIEYRSLLPALVAAVVGDSVTRGLGVEHTHFPVPEALALSPLVLGQLVLLGLAVAAGGGLFIEATHRLKAWAERVVPSLPLRMACGGLAVVALWQLSGTSDFLGLGTPTILRSFTDPTLPWHYPALKLVFTAVTLAFGFLGGEVTPLFFMGATLGNVVGRLVGLPLPLAAAIGMVAMLAAAANTPIALSVMAVELFGGAILPHVAVVAVVAYLMTGHRGIYPSQRLVRMKTGAELPKPVTLRDLNHRGDPEP